MRTKSIFLILITALFLSACGTTAKEDDHSSHAHGDIQEQTPSADIMPTFLNGQMDKIRLVYQIAGQASDLLQWIPCYCGCGDSAGHKSNLNCFIKEIKEDGSIIWDDHGTRCGVCLDIAAASAKLKSEGKSDKQIRAYIDATYQSGYANATDTPLPA